MSDASLTLTDLSKTFGAKKPFLSRVKPLGLRAVNGVNLTIRKGEIMGLVGESGCGKSTLARMVAGLIPPSEGSITFGPDVKRRQMVFQDPYSSLNPRWRVGDIVAEPILTHNLRPKDQVKSRVAELLRQVGLAPEHADRYPQDFSGGQRQRICIARALAAEPEFLILDEPTSALDVSVQAQILVLLKDLQRDLGLTCLFITHNLPVLRYMADRIGVMYLGELVELGPADAIFEAPRHPYTAKLIAAVPDLDTSDRSLHPIAGEMPSANARPQGCIFRNRCEKAMEICISTAPKINDVTGHPVACHAA